MYELLEKLNECIYTSEEYISFMKVKNELDDDSIHQLLIKYNDLKETYFSLKKYEKYADMSSVKEEYMKIRKEISENDIINDYYDKYYKLNEMLEEVTEIIFNGISDELIVDRYSL